MLLVAVFTIQPSPTATREDSEMGGGGGGGGSIIFFLLLLSYTQLQKKPISYFFRY